MRPGLVGSLRRGVRCRCRLLHILGRLSLLLALTRRYCAELNQSRRSVKTLGKAPPLGEALDGENIGAEGAEGGFPIRLPMHFPSFGSVCAPR